jgi:predicted dehydrogenase
MNYAVIGCGLIGKKRLAALPAGSRLVAACDSDPVRAEALVKLAGTGGAFADFKPAVASPEVDAVIVATYNGSLAEISAAAIRAGKHVLVEKPAAVSVDEIDGLIALADRQRVCVRVGFNYRLHPAFLAAREIFESGALGDPMYARARYGHGGRVGYDREWRADPKAAGGGALIDQGIHLIDLAGWFLGPFSEVAGQATTCFWNMPVDDNAFLHLRTAGGRTAWLHASCTEWKNLFSFEIQGRAGKLQIEGLGGSYGVETLHHHRVRPEMGPPETTVREFSGPDESWRRELAEFEADVARGQVTGAGLREARAALAIVEAIYQGKRSAQRAAGERSSSN